MAKKKEDPKKKEEPRKAPSDAGGGNPKASSRDQLLRDGLKTISEEIAPPIGKLFAQLFPERSRKWAKWGFTPVTTMLGLKAIPDKKEGLAGVVTEFANDFWTRFVKSTREGLGQAGAPEAVTEEGQPAGPPRWKPSKLKSILTPDEVKALRRYRARQVRLGRTARVVVLDRYVIESTQDGGNSKGESKKPRSKVGQRRRGNE